MLMDQVETLHVKHKMILSNFHNTKRRMNDRHRRKLETQPTKNWSPSRYLYEHDLKGRGESPGRDSPEGRMRRSSASRLVELTRSRVKS